MFPKMKERMETLINEINECRGRIRLIQGTEEMAQSIHYLRSGDKTINSYLEIGSAAGGTAYVFNKFFDIDTTVLIDDNCHATAGYRHDILIDIDYIEFIGNSQSKEAVAFVRNLDRMFDVVFIDGDHTYEGASADVVNYSPFVSPGGYLIMHDTVSAPGVKRVFEGVKNAGCFSVVEFYTGWCGTGIIKNAKTKQRRSAT